MSDVKKWFYVREVPGIKSVVWGKIPLF